MTTVDLRLVPGHPALNPPPAPCRDLKRVLRLDGETPEEMGTCSEVLAFDRRNKRPTMYRKQVLCSASIGEFVGFSTFDPASLAPFTHRTRWGGLRVDANYSDTQVTGSIVAKSAENKSFRVPLRRTAFDLYGVEVVMRSIALGVGLVLELEAFWPERASYVTARLTVIGSEPTRAGPDRYEPAWLVRLELDDIVSDYRVGAESHELLAQSQLLPDGARLDFVR